MLFSTAWELLKILFFQNAGERNFHIFYQLCAVSELTDDKDNSFFLAQGADQNIRNNYGIAEYDNYTYLAK